MLAGGVFGAAYAIGWFDSVEEMAAVADRYHGKRGIVLSGGATDARWDWLEAWA